ncbi:MAG: SpoIIIAH-like family protein [Faecalimonas sp.]|nr:SpoIIIAH-like family protein [Faecalimonas sp.]
MKRLFKKNQIIITSLAVMIAVAGYLNYSGRLFGDDLSEEGSEVANQELLDISMESGEADITETPGEAVLTGAEASGIVAEAKVTREQVRAKNKEMLQSIIDNQNLSDEQKQDAVTQMIAMTEIAEQEATIETLLLSKGFSEVVVNLTADSADVVVNATELTDANRAQIEDVIARKTEIAPENIVITPMHE